MHTNRFRHGNKGQAMVEFALVIVVLLFFIFAMIESARLFQANLTVQNAARAGGRYAITGQYEATCLTDTPPCEDPRVESIKRIARERMAGLELEEGLVFQEPHYYDIAVHTMDEDGNWDMSQESAGGPGDPVLVQVGYQVGLITPFVERIADTVFVTGEVVVYNEQYDQSGNSAGSNTPPQIPPAPTLGPSPTPVPPELEITKSAYPAPAIILEPLEYTLLIQNHGEVEATGIVVTDTLPGGVNVTNAGGCSQSGSTLTCNIGALGPQDSTTIHIVVEPQPTVAGETITNRAAVHGAQPDPDPSNNTVSLDTYIEDTPFEADLEVIKMASASLVSPGNPLDYSITVVNHGLAAATDVVMIDTLPGSVKFDRVAPTDSCGHSGEANGGTVTCTFGTIARNGFKTIAIRVLPQEEGTIENTATVSANEPQGDDIYPNTSTSTVEVRVAADVGINKSASPNPGIGELMRYTLTAFNAGPEDATNVQVVDSLPASVTYASAVASQGSCSESGKVVTCRLGTIARGSNATVTIEVRANQEGLIRNTAEVSSDTVDPNEANNTRTISTLIHPRTDLQLLSITPSADPVSSGDNFVYTIRVRNNGPSTATGVRLEDILAADTTFLSATATQGICGRSATSVSCSLGTLAPNGTATVSVRVIAVPTVNGPLASNEAQVTGNELDPDQSNNILSTNAPYANASTFIAVVPLCGHPGDTLTVTGYDWPDKNEELTITWDPNGPDATQLIYGPERFAISGGQWSRQITIPLDAGMDQVHTIRATRKSLSEEAEVLVPCPAPNLVISSGPDVVPAGAPLAAGVPVSFTVGIQNVGDLDAISQFFIGLYLDPVLPQPLGSTTHVDQPYRIGLVAVSGLAVGRGKTLNLLVPDGLPSGTHKIYAVVDSDPGPAGVIDEKVETDNISVKEVSVGAPGPGPTAGPSPTPSATAPSAPKPGSMGGQAINEAGLVQQQAEVHLFDENDNSLAATTNTDENGIYFVQDLAPGPYTVTACIVIESEAYYAYYPGVEIFSGQLTERNLFLELAPGGCGP